MNKDKRISLNGKWTVDYLSYEPYRDKIEPQTSNKAIEIENAVPGYFEDMEDIFRKAPFGKDIAINPLYEHQAYPMTKYAPDMALPNPLGCFVYTREFILDEVGKSPAVYFGGVQNRVSLFINGDYVSEHEGYSTDFSLDIEKDLLRIGKNRITLAVSNNRLSGYMDRPISGLTSRAACECSGGIYGDVELVFNESGINDVWVSTAKDLKSFTVHIVGICDKERTLTVTDGENEVTRVKINAGVDSVTLPSEGFKLWSPDSPNIYVAKITDEYGNLFCRRFGIRRLSADGTKLYLNGKPYFFRGICEHCYHPITVHPTRDKNYYKNIIKIEKSLGFNSIRFHTYVPPMEYMEAADEEGILIEVETPNNTTYKEWTEIVKMSRRYTCAIAFSSGNEMVIDEDYIEHLRAVADFVHNESDALFSPMSAMRGVEYFSYGDCQVDDPFPHNPKRLSALSEFCDLYNTYSLGLTSYTSASGDHETLDARNAIYKKPLLSHEICIHGTYCDLTLKDKYKNSRIGKTELFTSVEKHLCDVGLLDRADLYYKNSVKWQKFLRKKCFELVRRSESFAGYDFLGDIDTHWHTFGYCVGMMNEFYEMKPGESVENVRRYNSDAVLLADLPKYQSVRSGDKIDVPILISNYGDDLSDITLKISLATADEIIRNDEIKIKAIASGTTNKLCTLSENIKNYSEPKELTLTVKLISSGVIAENEWQIYVFPTPCDKIRGYNVTVSDGMSENELLDRLDRGERVLIFGAKPFQYEGTSFQISLAGRTNGHLATVINRHKLTENLPHSGFLGSQFEGMLNSGRAVILDLANIKYEPIIEIATSYKNAHREALMFEYTVGRGKLLVCSLNLSDDDCAALWLKREIENYAASEDFAPKISISKEELTKIISADVKRSEANTNLAFNKNDITAN